MSTTHETEKDRQNEREVAEILAKRSGMQAVKNKDHHRIDWSFLRGEVVWGVAEIKCRHLHYDQMMVSLDKIQALRECAASGLEARMVFATPAGIFVKKIGPEGIDGWIGMGGRADRGHSEMEPCVYFGNLTVGGMLIKEEKEPMVKIAESKPEWFQ